MAKKTGTFEVSNSELGFKGFICVKSIHNGMAFGGCRMSPSVTREEVEELAHCMDLKLAAHGRPVGGAKGGIQISPASPNLKPALAAFAKAMKEVLSTTAILGKDLGATTESMDHLYAAIGIPQMHIAQKGPAAARMPDKLRDMTGYQSHMTGLGVITAANRAVGGQLAKKAALIQGCGAVGAGAAMRLFDMGAKVRGISDVEVAIFKSDGLSPADLSRIVRDGRIDTSEADRAGCEIMPSSALFRQQADVLILAAASHSVTDSDAQGMACDTVVEGSNFGLFPDARTTLFKRGIVVVPDVIASSSSAAMVAHQMQSCNGYTHDQLWKKILTSIELAVEQTMEMARSENVDMRTAYTKFHSEPTAHG